VTTENLKALNKITVSHMSIGSPGVSVDN